MPRFRLLVFSILLFLLALPVRASVPDTGPAQRQAAAAAALAWLRQQQTMDGRVGGLGASCEVAWVAALAGQDPGGPAWKPAGASLLDACEADVPTYLARRDVGRMGKVLRAVAAAGANPRQFGGLDLIAEIESRYDPGLGLYDPNFLFRQSLAILGLHEAGRPLPAGLLPAWLAQQHADGGWSWLVEANPAGGFITASDLDATARALQVLRALGLPYFHPAYAAAANYVAGQQRPDGGWGLMDGPTNANSTALAIEALLAAGWDAESPRFVRNGQTPVALLMGLQEASGAFIYRPGNEESRFLATLDAIPALLHPFPGDVAQPLRFYLPVMLAGQPSL